MPTTSPASLGVGFLVLILGIAGRNMIVAGSPFSLEPRGMSLPSPTLGRADQIATANLGEFHTAGADCQSSRPQGAVPEDDRLGVSPDVSHVTHHRVAHPSHALPVRRDSTPVDRPSETHLGAYGEVLAVQDQALHYSPPTG